MLDTLLVWINTAALVAIVAACLKSHEMSWHLTHWLLTVLTLLLALGAIWTIADTLAAGTPPALSATLFRLAIAGLVVRRAFSIEFFGLSSKARTTL